jgi:CheY-like chemotaxis protein
MPLMNGVQFINMIRLEDKNQKIPVVAVIPDGDKNIKKEFQNIGVNIILKKPVDMDLLADKLGGLLQNM